MSDFEKLINASDLIEWIMEAYPDWCVGAIRSIVDHINELPSAQSEPCDDCISRQAAIDAILHNQELYSHNFGDDPIDKYTIAIIDNDAQTIAQLPSAQPERKGKWIPVSEGLPEYDRRVLCQTMTKKGVPGFVLGYYTGEFWACGMNSNVVAWMPLPDPYKEEP